MDTERIRLFGVPYKTANGKEFTFLWTNRSVARAEDEGLGAPGCGPNKSMRLLVWACLSSLTPEATPDDASDMIDLEMAHGRLEALCDAIRTAREKAEGAAYRPPQPELVKSAS